MLQVFFLNLSFGSFYCVMISTLYFLKFLPCRLKEKEKQLEFIVKIFRNWERM